MNQRKPLNFGILMSPIMAFVELVRSLKRSLGSLPALRSGPSRPLQKPESWLHVLPSSWYMFIFFCIVHTPVQLGTYSSPAGYCFCLRVHCVAAWSQPVWVCWEGSMALVASGPFPLAQLGEGSQVEVNQFCEIWAELLKSGNCMHHHIANERFGKGLFM